jgi:hypothetical protein
MFFRRPRFIIQDSSGLIGVAYPFNDEFATDTERAFYDGNNVDNITSLNAALLK